ncbi:MAG: hypothetical protein PHX78_00985 [bacterium]|nr:hypothetical protein [bacterium]
MAVWQAISSKKLVLGLRLDPEIYKPTYTNLLKNLKDIDSKNISYFNPKINRGKLPVYTEQGDVHVIKSAKIKNGFVDESCEYTESSFMIKNPESEARYGDILINSTGRGTLGRSAILMKNNNKYIIDGHITKITELKNISKYYLAVYLLSKYGYVQLDTMARGSSGQTEIYTEDINAVLIPILPTVFQKEIDKSCRCLYENIEKTKNYYSNAEQELLERLEWNKVDTQHILNYSASSKIISENERLDPEFYQPKFEYLIKQLNKAGAKKLGEFCPLPNRGVQPLYVDKGEILVINSKHLGPTEIDIENSERTSKLFYEEANTTKAKLQQYDVLMYSTGAYVGRTNVYLENIKGIASNHVAIIRPDNKICNPVYLALFLNSPAGLMQTDQRASGSAQREIYPQDIVKYKVFIPQNKNGKPDLEWQNKLADKVVQANQAKKEAKQKLQGAKELVEKEIEKMLTK